MFQKFSFKSRLLILSSFLCAISVIVGIVGYFALTGVSEQYKSMTQTTVPKMDLAYQMFLEFREVRIHTRTLDSKTVSAEDLVSAVKKVKEHIAAYDELNKKYLALGVNPKQKPFHDSVEVVWKDYKESALHGVDAYSSTEPEDVKYWHTFITSGAPKKAKAYMEAMNQLVAYHQGSMHNKIAAAESTADYSIFVLAGVILAGGLIGAIASFLFANGIFKNLSAISTGLEKGAVLVERTANAIASASDQLASGASEQAAALQETTASLEETSAMISKNADNARRSTEVSNTSQRTVANGKSAVEEMIVSIDEISQSSRSVGQQVEEGNKEIEAIVKVIAEIGSKTKVINDIVFQTKLLSFNASVEAARAGEHGKGFAVVAEEVGKLAQMSGAAAKEITEMLDESIRKVEQIVGNTKSRVSSLMTASQTKVEGGIKSAKKCAELLDAIVSDVSEVGTMIVEISGASEEQAKGVQEINKAMTQLDSVSQQNSSASHLAASSAQELRTEVDQLRGMLLRLNATINGQKSADQSAGHHASSDAAGKGHAHSNVLRMPTATHKAEQKSWSQEKIAVNGSATIPSANDSRFEDI